MNLILRVILASILSLPLAAFFVMGVAVVFVAVFITVHHYFHKKSGGRS